MYLLIGSGFIVALYTVIAMARLAEQEARISCNNMFRSLGLDEMYSLKEIDSID